MGQSRGGKNRRLTRDLKRIAQSIRGGAAAESLGRTVYAVVRIPFLIIRLTLSAEPSTADTGRRKRCGREVSVYRD